MRLIRNFISDERFFSSFFCESFPLCGSFFVRGEQKRYQIELDAEALVNKTLVLLFLLSSFDD